MASAKSTSKVDPISHLDDMIDTSIKVSEDLAKSHSDNARKGFESFVAFGRESLDAVGDKTRDIEGLSGITEIRKDNFEAIVESGKKVAAGVDELGVRAFSIVRRQANDGAKVRRDLVAAKTVDEVVRIQQDYTRKVFDDAIKDGMAFSQAWMSVAADAGRPISARFAELATKSMRTPV